MMTYNLDKILKKYFNGETSLDEEKWLRNYFSNGNVADEYLQYAPLFQFFGQQEQTILHQEMTNSNVKKTKHMTFGWIGAVACILIIIGFGIIFSLTENNSNKSMAYINGKKISDVQTINSQALIALSNVSDIDEETVDSQIAILDSFIE